MDGLWGKIGMATALIAPAETTSGVIDLREIGQLAALVMPEAFTGASLTFQASVAEDGTYRTIYFEGADYTVVVTAAKFVVIDPTIFHGVVFLKLVSSVAEAAQRSITVVGRDFS